MIKIVIFSDIRIYCEGLSRILSRHDAIEVVDAGNSLQHALVKVEQSRPHVIVLDMTMPNSCGFAGLVGRRLPQVRIVAIAVPADEQNIIECAEAGISGYIAREASVQELIKTVCSVHKGKFCCPPQIAAALFNKVQNIARKAKEDRLKAPGLEPGAVFQDLTRREKQILGLVADGLSNKEIARVLAIEVSTVKNHVHNILVKLEVHSRIQAVALFQNKTHPGRFGSFRADRGGQVYL